MTKDDFYRWWHDLLDKLGISERQAAAMLGLTQQNVNQKVKAGTLRFVDVQNLLEAHQKTLTVTEQQEIKK